jgi:hypothetical protein
LFKSNTKKAKIIKFTLKDRMFFLTTWIKKMLLMKFQELKTSMFNNETPDDFQFELKYLKSTYIKHIFLKIKTALQTVPYSNCSIVNALSQHKNE